MVGSFWITATLRVAISLFAYVAKYLSYLSVRTMLAKYGLSKFLIWNSWKLPHNGETLWFLTQRTQAMPLSTRESIIRAMQNHSTAQRKLHGTFNTPSMPKIGVGDGLAKVKAFKKKVKKHSRVGR